MSDVNFNTIKEHTYYGDLTGVIQIDGHSNISSIYDLCKDHEFDMSNKFVIGFGIEESTILGVGKDESASCSILYVDKSEYGDNYEAIERKVRNEGILI